MSFVNEMERKISGKTALLMKIKDPVTRITLKTFMKL